MKPLVEYSMAPAPKDAHIGFVPRKSKPVAEQPAMTVQATRFHASDTSQHRQKEST
jgi:hypothetical protein